MAQVVFVERVPDFGHPAVHHVRWRDHVRPCLGVGQRGPGQEIQRGVVVDGMPFDDAAMAVIGVFAQTDIGNDHQIRQFVLDLADGPLHDAFFGVSLGAQRVFLVRQAKENDRRYSQMKGFLGGFDEVFRGKLVVSGHGWDGVFDASVRQWQTTAESGHPPTAWFLGSCGGRLHFGAAAGGGNRGNSISLTPWRFLRR